LGLKDPPAPLSLHDITPIILEAGLELSATVAVNVIWFPAVNDVELGEIVVVVLSGVVLVELAVVLVELAAVDMFVVPVLGAWVPSPEYSADITMVFGEFTAEVYDIEQVPDDIVQESGENEPPAWLSFHDISPVREDGELEVSVTVALNETVPPRTKVVTLGLTETVVV